MDSTCHRHGGTQKMLIQDGSESLTVPFALAGCMVHFKHRIPTSEEFGSPKQYCLTQGETLWNPSSFSDQVADKFYQLVIAHEKHNANINSKKDSVRKDPPQLKFFDPSNAAQNQTKSRKV